MVLANLLVSWFFTQNMSKIGPFLTIPKTLNHFILRMRKSIIPNFYYATRGKSLLESWVTTFLPDWQLPLMFIRFISNFLCMCSNSVASAHVILKYLHQTKIKGCCQSRRKDVPHDSKSDLPLAPIVCRPLTTDHRWL